MAWRTRAACSGADTGLFFEARGPSAAEAKAICRGCQVKAECLAFAAKAEAGLGAGDRHGIFGEAGPTARWAAEFPEAHAASLASKPRPTAEQREKWKQQARDRRAELSPAQREAKRLRDKRSQERRRAA
jgi:WhiB family redox-sensing transcriptional regulator